MFREIFHFLVNISTNLIGEALLLRAWLVFSGVPSMHPMMLSLARLTDWIILPLRRLRIFHRQEQFDFVSLFAAWIIAFLNLIIVAILFGFDLRSLLQRAAIASFLVLCKWMLNLVSWSTILYVLISWINPLAPTMLLTSILLNPLLIPLRKFLPDIRAIDLSPLVLMIFVAVLQALLARFWVYFPNMMF